MDRTIPTNILYVTEDNSTVSLAGILVRATSLLHSLEGRIRSPDIDCVKEMVMPFRDISDYSTLFKVAYDKDVNTIPFIISKHQEPYIDVLATHNFIRIWLYGWNEIQWENHIIGKGLIAMTVQNEPSAEVCEYIEQDNTWAFPKMLYKGDCGYQYLIIEAYKIGSSGGRLEEYNHPEKICTKCQRRIIYKNKIHLPANSIPQRITPEQSGGFAEMPELPDVRPDYTEKSDLKLTFERFGITNFARCADWHKNEIRKWTTSDWAMATAGEFGELCNILKKLNREKDGIRGNLLSDHPISETFNEEIMKEIGGTYAYLDLLCQHLGLRMEDCVRFEFNRISDRGGLEYKI